MSGVDTSVIQGSDAEEGAHVDAPYECPDHLGMPKSITSAFYLTSKISRKNPTRRKVLRCEQVLLDHKFSLINQRHPNWLITILGKGYTALHQPVSSGLSVQTSDRSEPRHCRSKTTAQTPRRYRQTRCQRSVSKTQ